MKFRKEIDVPESKFRISRHDKVGVFGSCFSWEVADNLDDDLYHIWRSPFGISYNPVSMYTQLSRLIHNEGIAPDELFEANGAWHSFAHHSEYSGSTLESTMNGMQRDFTHALKDFKDTSIFIITWGTAYYYSLIDDGMIVNNCHKLPSSTFRRSRASVEEIVKYWNQALDDVKALKPDVRFIFTVSPIPHYSDGIHEHTLSKSILHIAMDEIIAKHSDIAEYFPAYEIMREELRDYRFYKEDMAHPTLQAVTYIMEKFRKAYTSEDTESYRAWASLKGQLRHIPLTSNPQQLTKHYTELLTKVEELQTHIRHHKLELEAFKLMQKIKDLK